MPLHDYECEKGHQFEANTEWFAEETACIKCEAEGEARNAQRVWIARRGAHRQLSDPVVLFRYADGSTSFPGSTSAPTPRDAERIECRTMQDYSREMRQVNAWENARANRANERIHRQNEAAHAQYRSDVVAQMSQESDPMAKALLRRALESYNTDAPVKRESQIYSEAMEYDRSNREEYWDKSTGIRGRK